MRTKSFFNGANSRCFVHHHSSEPASHNLLRCTNGSGTQMHDRESCGLNTALQLAAGDTLYLRGGSYKQTVSFSTNGTSTSRITIAVILGKLQLLMATTQCHPTGVLYSMSLVINVLFEILRLWIVYSMGLILRGTYNEAINVYSHGNWEKGS